jgi:3-methyl-2-oxobutanoate hydroxymethyltransferase
MLRVLTLEEAEAAERAGVDMVSIPPEFMLNPQERDAAPSLFTMPGDNVYEIGTADDFVRWAMLMYKASADAVYCSASHATVKRMADEAIAVIGHVGLIPSRKTWTGGFKAIARSPPLPCPFSKPSSNWKRPGPSGRKSRWFGSRSPRPFANATGCSCFRWAPARDARHNICSPPTVLGQNRGHMRRRSKAYRNFAAEYERLQAERVAALSKFVADVSSRACPQERHVLDMDPDELGSVMANIDAE